jgi:HAE1 family hydrophobic/amphiphilic exporter-1
MKTLRHIEEHIFSKVNPAVRFSVSRYVLAIGFFVAIVAFGFLCTFNLGVDMLPAVNIPFVSVTTSYPGANPGVIDQQVTQVIENALSTLSGITDLNSTSSIGLSRLNIAFELSADKNAVANQVAAIVAASVRKLPNGINPPIVQTFDPSSQPIIQFGVFSTGDSLSSVSDYIQNTMIPALQNVKGVANVSLDGAPVRQFQVLLNPDKLRNYNLTPQQVINSIANTSVNVPIGTIIHQNSTLTFSTQNVSVGVEQIRQSIVDSSRGINVDDLGMVRDVPVSSNIARVNGIPVVLVSVQRTTDSNSVQVVKAIQTKIDSMNLPGNYKINYSNDTTGPIRASIDSTFRELLMTVVVVAFIVLLFLGKLNTAISVIFAIPIALAASPILYKLCGFSFNLVSLLAIIIAIGIVVDDSIVVAENVERYRAMGIGLKESVLKGASEVFSAVVAASLSLLSVLIPVSLFGGDVGRYLQQFSLGLAAAVFFSLLEAVLFLTVRLAYTSEDHPHSWKIFFETLRDPNKSFGWGFKNFKKPLGIVVGLAAAGVLFYFKLYIWLLFIPVYPVILGIVKIVLEFVEALTATLHSWTEFVMDRARNGYAHILGRVLKAGPVVLIVCAIFLGVSAFLIVPSIPFNFVPQTDSGVLSANVRFPRGTAINLINDAAGKLEKYLLDQPEVVTVQTVVGGNAQMLVQLVPNEKRRSVFDLIPAYRKAMAPILKDQPSARISVSASAGYGGFGGSSFTIFVAAADFNMLLDRNAKIIDSLQSNQWVVDVNSSLSDTNLENDFIPDPDKLKGTGISPASIAQALQTYTTGTQASNVVTGGISYPIQVQINPIYLSGTQSLLDLPVYSPTLGTSLPVGQLGKFILNVSPVSLARYNRQYIADIDINLKPSSPPALTVQNQLTADLKSSGLLDNGFSVSVQSRGPTALASQLAKSGPPIFLLALFLAYLVMAAQFNSWRYPIYLLLPVPLALVGAFWLIFIIGGGLDIFGLMGMLMLIGLSAKNAILYLDFVVERISKMPLHKALIEAAQLRFRPIIMTTLTVLVISFPLIFGSGQGSEFGQRMGIVMFGGIVFSAILTFFIVPAAFYLFEKKKTAIAYEAAHEKEASEGRKNAKKQDGIVDVNAGL